MHQHTQHGTTCTTSALASINNRRQLQPEKRLHVQVQDVAARTPPPPAHALQLQQQQHRLRTPHLKSQLEQGALVTARPQQLHVAH